MIQFASKIKAVIYEKLVRPVKESHSPLNELALGMGVGMFWALTPLVGIQMYLVMLNWMIFKFLFKKDFDWLVGIALVWISNPFTMIPMYFTFYWTGAVFMDFAAEVKTIMSFGAFSDKFQSIQDNPLLSAWGVIVESAKFLLLELGFPMIIGCLFYAIPVSIISYIWSYRMIGKNRKRKAEKMNMDYEDWKKQFEKSRNLNFSTIKDLFSGKGEENKSAT